MTWFIPARNPFLFLFNNNQRLFFKNENQAIQYWGYRGQSERTDWKNKDWNLEVNRPTYSWLNEKLLTNEKLLSCKRWVRPVVKLRMKRGNPDHHNERQKENKTIVGDRGQGCFSRSCFNYMLTSLCGDDDYVFCSCLLF